jgi:acyl carrier protein
MEISMDVMQRVKRLFVENFDFSDDNLKPEATLDSLGLDSLDKIDFMFVLEKEFDIIIPDRDVRIITIQDMLDVIEKLITEQHVQTAS